MTEIVNSLGKKWLRGEDLNLRPLGYEPTSPLLLSDNCRDKSRQSGAASGFLPAVAVAKILSALSSYPSAMFAFFFAAQRETQPDTKPPRIFRIALGKMNVTVHSSDDLQCVRVLQSDVPKYFIDDQEVDQQTFDRELERE